uniref:Uncharacterized protein n=1 Tax=Arcella intermedia TaxID=1963864 RepID=A0A6B2KXA6_9EUKA
MDSIMQHKFSKGAHYNMKIVLRGEANTGKTCLFHRLQGRGFVGQYDPTPRIQISHIHWDYKVTNDVVKVEVWDVVDKAKVGVINEDLISQIELSKSSKVKSGSTFQMQSLDASTVDVMQGTHAVIFTCDPFRLSSWEYVKREIAKISPKVYILVLANFKDKTGSPQVTLSTMINFVQNSGENVKLLESSMLNCYGLKGVKSFLNLPFLLLKREELEIALQKNEEEVKTVNEELEYLTSNEDYEKYVQMMKRRENNPPSPSHSNNTLVTPRSQNPSNPAQSPRSVSNPALTRNLSVNPSNLTRSDSGLREPAAKVDVKPTLPQVETKPQAESKPKADSSPVKLMKAESSPTKLVQPQNKEKEDNSIFNFMSGIKDSIVGPKNQPDEILAEIKALSENAKVSGVKNESIDDFVVDDTGADDWLSEPTQTPSKSFQPPKKDSDESSEEHNPLVNFDDEKDESIAVDNYSFAAPPTKIIEPKPKISTQPNFNTKSLSSSNNTISQPAPLDEPKSVPQPKSQTHSNSDSDSDSDGGLNPLVAGDDDEIDTSFPTLPAPKINKIPPTPIPSQPKAQPPQPKAQPPDLKLPDKPKTITANGGIPNFTEQAKNAGNEERNASPSKAVKGGYAHFEEDGSASPSKRTKGGYVGFGEEGASPAKPVKSGYSVPYEEKKAPTKAVKGGYVGFEEEEIVHPAPTKAVKGGYVGFDEEKPVPAKGKGGYAGLDENPRTAPTKGTKGGYDAFDDPKAGHTAFEEDKNPSPSKGNKGAYSAFGEEKKEQKNGRAGYAIEETKDKKATSNAADLWGRDIWDKEDEEEEEERQVEVLGDDDNWDFLPKDDFETENSAAFFSKLAPTYPLSSSPVKPLSQPQTQTLPPVQAQAQAQAQEGSQSPAKPKAAPSEGGRGATRGRTRGTRGRTRGARRGRAPPKPAQNPS